MGGITVRECYRYLRDSECRLSPEEFFRFNMSLLSESARAFMYAAFLGQGGDGRATAFIDIAKERGTAEDCVYARHLESALTYVMLKNPEEAISIGKEVVDLARDLADEELEGDALMGISTIYEDMGDATAAKTYEREAARVRERNREEA
jgi:tetratricopeptide (TPR) repeat protein